jgi:GNAT superfamily N-acetyltransferase
MRVELRATTPSDRVRVDGFVRERRGASTVVAHGATYRPSGLPGFVALEGGELLGVVTYSIDGEACEIVTIDSLVERAGIGTALVEAVTDAARAAGCRRLWLVTTNDNLPAPASIRSAVSPSWRFIARRSSKRESSSRRFRSSGLTASRFATSSSWNSGSGPGK